MVVVESDRTEPHSELFNRNLGAFKNWAPRIYARLSGIEAPNTILTADAEGRIDMTLRGQGFYDGDAEGYTSLQLKAFFERPSRQTISEPDPVKLQGTCGTFCLAVKERLSAAGLDYDGVRCPVDSHSLVVFGVGLGLHIASLVDRTAARVVLLIEPNIEFLYHSLFVIEWYALFEQAEEDGREFTFITERDSATIASIARRVLHRSNPALIDGIYIYSHYPSIVLDQAKDQVRHDLFLTLSGMGFFEDELMMTGNGVANLCRAPLAVLGRYHPPRPEPLFIVGSGPSVEQDLEVIAENADKAVVIAIGTGLGVLLSNGIRPDFHVELENGVGTLEMMEATAKTYDLSGITLIASVTVQPAMVLLFDKCIHFFRERVSSTELFCGPFNVVQPAGPTVANTALICGIRMGFREIYLFGVDMGSKVDGRFHAKGSAYAAGIRPDPTVASQSFPGNFGGEVSGEAIFNWSRRVLEGAIKAHRGITTYNCSDGVRIEGAIPMVSRVLELADEPLDQGVFLEAMATSLHRYDRDRLRQAWVAEEKRAELLATFGEIDEILERALTAREPDLAWFHEIYDIIRPDADTGVVAKSFLSGTLSISMGCINWYDRRLSQAERRAELRRLMTEIFRATVADMKVRLEALYDEVDEQVAAL